MPGAPVRDMAPLMRRLVLLLSVVAAFGFAAPPTSSFAAHSYVPHTPGTKLIDNYVPVAEDDPTKATQLRMQAEYPKAPVDGRFPTLLVYQGYSHKLGPTNAFRTWATKQGYAVMVVSVRGAGCSGGSYDFLSEQEAADGEDVINWITRQKWSNGKVALIGDSYAGLEQLPVAARRPQGLVAIAPGQPVADLYRDVAYPGGISNTFLGAGFSADVHVDLYPEAPHESLAVTPVPDATVDDNKPQCLQNQTAAPGSLTGTAAGLFAAHRWDDGEIHKRAPGRNITNINVPTFTVVGWQDETVGSRAIVELPKVSGPFHAVLSNGGHGWSAGVWYATRAQKRLQEFLDFYVRGIDNGFGTRSPIEVWWESERGADPDGPNGPDTEIVPRWTSDLPRMPAPQDRETTFFLSAKGELSPGLGSGGPDQYEYVGGTGQYHREPVGTPVGSTPPEWSDPPAPGKSLVYTSPPLEKDLVVLGSASLDVWLDSTATDTDLQAVLTEVRPDQADAGEQLQEMYVQAGWLRASHRTLDGNQSIPTRPFHTHQFKDTKMLTPLKPELMRVEIRPFGHVFRAGSRLRLSIEAPPAKTGNWTFESLPGPALNRVYHDLARPSALRLATLPGHTAPKDKGYPACGTVIRQPCRATTVPTGGQASP